MVGFGREIVVLVVLFTCTVRIYFLYETYETGELVTSAEGATAPETLRRKDRFINKIWRVMAVRHPPKG